MNAIPHSVTYGSTVYEKGPDVVHTLRNHMGDSLFFSACQDYMDTLAFGNANSQDLRDVFQTSSGLDLNPFFDGWIFEAGFPHFQVDSFKATYGLNAFDVELSLRQKQRANSHIYEMSVPINLTNGTHNWDVVLELNQEVQNFTVVCPFEPTMVTIDRWEKMSDAVADHELEITSSGNYQFENTNVTVNVLNSGTDSSTVRVEDHFVQPDGFIGENPGILLNPYHYWSVDGIFSNDFLASAEFEYNGSTNMNTGHMDNELIITEDSLVFMHRSSAGYEWEEVVGYEIVTGASVTNKRGSVSIDTLKRGEYVLARYDFTASVFDQVHDSAHPFAFPNPTHGELFFNLPVGIWNAMLVDVKGSTVGEWEITGSSKIDINQLTSGIYLLEAKQGIHVYRQKVIIE